MSGSCLRTLRGGLGIPETEWSLLQPYIDRANNAAIAAQTLAADALARGAITEAEYASVVEGDAYAFSGVTLEASLDQVMTRGDAARHVRDDATMIDDTRTWAEAVEADLERFRVQIGGGASSYRTRMIFTTLAAATAGIVIVGGLVVWSRRKKR